MASARVSSWRTRGFAKALTTTTAQPDIYAFSFDQAGAMAGLGLRGSKITKINP